MGFQFRKAVNFTMKRQKVRKLLEELETSNGWLDTYANKAEKLEAPYMVNRRSKFAISLNVIEKNAARLYTSLSRVWCSAHHAHHAGLLLEPRLVKKRRRPAYQRKERADNIEPNLFVLSLIKYPAPKKWLEVEFRLEEALTDSQLNRFVECNPVETRTTH